ncbi:hypothetical protein GGI35DRAFT_447071 [Trichoderma velutinum]
MCCWCVPMLIYLVVYNMALHIGLEQSNPGIALLRIVTFNFHPQDILVHWSNDSPWRYPVVSSELEPRYRLRPTTALAICIPSYLIFYPPSQI